MQAMAGNAAKVCKDRKEEHDEKEREQQEYDLIREVSSR